jgi:hypothetical protein
MEINEVLPSNSTIPIRTLHEKGCKQADRPITRLKSWMNPKNVK